MTDPQQHFKVEEGDDYLTDFKFSQEDIEKACDELRGTAAPGPDGVPAVLLKNCRKELSKPLPLAEVIIG